MCLDELYFSSVKNLIPVFGIFAHFKFGKYYCFDCLPLKNHTKVFLKMGKALVCILGKFPL